MNFSKAHSIEELFERVSQYDTVITKDPALADALNLRLEKPIVGQFAATPRGLVYRRELEADMRGRQKLFLELLDRTDLHWKEAYYYLQQSLNCWEETGSLSSVENYDRFDNPHAKTVLDVLRTIDSVFAGMQRYNPRFDGDVAVVDPEKFTPLDRNVFPEAFDSVSLLDPETSAELPSFRIFPSTTSLIHAVTKNVNSENANDVAVIIEPSSQYQPLLESHLQVQNIPYMQSRTLTEDENFRTLFTLMRSAFTRSRLRVRDVMPVVHRFDRRIPLEHHDTFLTHYDHEAIQPFREMLDQVNESTYGQILDLYETRTEVELNELREVLERLQLIGRPITPETLNDLEFYLDNFDVEMDTDKHGVLFASPKKAAVVDRSIVFYLGMDSSWTRTIPDQPWIEYDRHRTTNLNDFQVLLQNGEHQYYLVQEHHMNADVTPCFYFNVLFEDFETFSDATHETMSGLPKLELSSGFDHKPLSLEPEPETTMSQSSLNRFVKSPRDYFFDRLVPTIENLPMRKGKIFHDFAEFFVNHPRLVNDTEPDEFVRIMEESMQSIADEWACEQMRTEFRIGINTIEAFLEKNGFDAFRPAGYQSDVFDRSNIFGEHFEDVCIDNPISEAWFQNESIGGHGAVDLIPHDDQLIDLKSGSSRSPKTIVEQSRVNQFKDDPNFQAILYLAHHRRQYPNQELEFTFFHFLENVSDALVDEAKLEDTLVTVTSFPRQFHEQVPRKRTYKYLTSGVKSSNDRRKTLEGIGYDMYRQFFEQNQFPDVYVKDEVKNTEIADRFISYAHTHFKEAKYVTKGARKTLKKLVSFRQQNFFEQDFRRFENFLTEQIKFLNQCRENKFPVEHEVEDLDLDDLNHRDLIVDDRYGT